MKVIYQDEDLLAADKPAGVNCDDFEKRIHRLDKDTSGVFLIAKNDQALIFFQKQFKNREVEKKYLALVIGNVKSNQGRIETLIGRSKKDGKKQKVYLPLEPGAKLKRDAVTEYRVIKRFDDYTLVEAMPRTGRKHQIRCQLAYLGHPIAGDNVYGFKNQPRPQGLKRQFLHAGYLKIKLFNGKYKELSSPLAKDLKLCLQALKKKSQI